MCSHRIKKGLGEKGRQKRSALYRYGKTWRKYNTIFQDFMDFVIKLQEPASAVESQSENCAPALGSLV